MVRDMAVESLVKCEEESSDDWFQKGLLVSLQDRQLVSHPRLHALEALVDSCRLISHYCLFPC